MIDEAKLSKLVEDAVRRVVGVKPQPAEDDVYISVAHAAARVDVHPATIREWQDEGRLGTYWAGRERRVLRSELDALMRRPPAERPTRTVEVEETPEEKARKRFQRAG